MLDDSNNSIIEEIHLKDVENAKLAIDASVVEDAISVVKESHFSDSESVLYFLSALNLLNAAVKKSEFKTRLDYGFIKRKASEAAECIIENGDMFPNISVYFRIEDNCLFLKAFDVIFSYHSIKRTPTILKSAGFAPIIWSGVRLQPIAQPLYLYVKQWYLAQR
jgi:hypothetical protein